MNKCNVFSAKKPVTKITIWFCVLLLKSHAPGSGIRLFLIYLLFADRNIILSSYLFLIDEAV